jgi:hypothetical protein
LKPTNSILGDVRLSVGLAADTSDFDTELLMHTNAAIGTLNQNGIGKDLLVTDTTPTWNDLQEPTQLGNSLFKMVPLFIMLSTKVLFDPPPPSSVQVHQSQIEQLLWRLKIAYEEPYTTTTTTLQ